MTMAPTRPAVVRRRQCGGGGGSSGGGGGGRSFEKELDDEVPF